MDDLNDLKALWLTAKTDSLPTSSEVMQLVKKFRWQKLARKIMLIASACVIALLMVFVIFTYHSTMLTTRIGELLIIAACIVLATTNIRSIKRFYDLKDCSNKEFLQFVEQTRLNQLRYYRKTQVMGLLLCSCGLLFYLYEIVCYNILLVAFVYTLAAIYLCFIWFVLRPRRYKKSVHDLNATKEKLEQFLHN